MGRKKLDKYLERKGLLDYQTKGLSAQEIADKYAKAGMKLQGDWFEQHYGSSRPQVPAQQPSQPSQPPAGTRPIQVTTQARTVQPNEGIQYHALSNGLIVRSPARGTGISKFQENITQINPSKGERIDDPTMHFGATNEQALKGEVNWADVSVRDRTDILKDPNFYKQNKITTYPKWMQQQILADPSFDWGQLPKWQKYYYQLSSSPVGMGAAQGAILGSFGGPVGGLTGAAIGAGLGAWAGHAGYDQTKEFWQQDSNVAAGFGLFNWLAEQAEKTIGVGFQAAQAVVDPNRAVADVLNKESWNAAAVTFETLAPPFQAAVKGDGLTMDDALKIAPTVWILSRIGDLILHPEKYKGNELYLGADVPVKLDQTWIERIDQAREEIKAGRPYREVMTEMQTGVIAQIGDMAGQGIADPLNFLPKVETKVGAAIAKAGGHEVAAQALQTSGGLTEAARKYKTLVQTSAAQTIEPGFKVDQMGLFSRWFAGVTTEGGVRKGSLIPTGKGLLDPVTKKYSGFVDSMFSQTPHSRAQTGAGMFYENVGTLLTMFDDPHEAGKYLTALAKSDMETWAQLGSRFAESPEFYTVLPALKDFDAGTLNGFIQTWDMSQPNRDALTRMADILGQEPAKLLEDWARRDTHEQDLARIVERAKSLTEPSPQPSPDGRGGEAATLLNDIQEGRITPDTLKQIVDVFTGEGALAWHPGQWKAQMLDALGDHFDQWVTKRLMLDQSPEAKSAFFRTTALMKQAQSILLLGGSPGYALQNGMSNMTHRMMTGNFGYLTPNQINGFMDRLGVTPARYEEGVGIGGQVELKDSLTPTLSRGERGLQTEAMTKAVKGQGPLTTAKGFLSKISKGMPFSKLSAQFEKIEGRQAFVIGMKQMWSQSWRRGVGFSKMGADLARVIGEMGIDPNRIYAAIEAGMNQGEIEKQLFGRYEGVQARSLINDAAQKTGMTSSRAADILEKIGVLDVLDGHLKGKNTPDGVRSAFTRANQVAQDWIDMQTGEDLKAIAESVKQRVGLEGAASGLDVVQKANGAFFDAWQDHYHRFGEVMDDILTMDDPAMIDKAIDLNYQISDDEFRRVYARTAANYKGIFDAWGLSGDPEAMTALSAIGEIDGAMKQAYDRMREIRKGLSEKYRGQEKGNAFFDDLDQARKQQDAIFKDAFAAKHRSEVRMGDAIEKIYGKLYGPAAGEAAHLWWEDVIKFNDEIVTREKSFRESLKGMTKDERAIAKQKYYSTDKVAMIAELEKINSEGIARLERVIRKGGPPTADGGPGPEPTPPTMDRGPQTTDEATPQFTPLPMAEDLLAQAGQRTAQEFHPELQREGFQYHADQQARERQQAEQTRQANPELDAYMRAAEAPRPASTAATPPLSAKVDEVNALLEQAKQRTAKAFTEYATRMAGVWEVAGEYSFDGMPYDPTQSRDTFALLGALRKEEYGGDPSITKLNDPRVTPEFVKKVLDARSVIKTAAEALTTSTSSVRRLPSTLTGTRPEGRGVLPFDQALWQTDFADTMARGDLTHLYELIGEFPDEMLGSPSPQPSPEGRGGFETFRDYMSRVADEVAARVERENQNATVAESMARSEAAIREQETRAEAVTTRNLLKEKFQDVFGLSEEQSQAYMELSDSIASWYARVTGESADAFYARYYGDVVSTLTPDPSPKTGEGGDALFQGIEPVNRKMTPAEIEAYARALVRAGEGELGAAIRNEASKADRRAILEAAHKLDPSLAEKVAKDNLDELFQTLTPTLSQRERGKYKGVVTFDADGIKATIHAFKARDITTLIHENGHVFRRVLKDVGERTNNPRILEDLKTIEDWAGVRDGKWSRAHEEKFAQGFEKYVTEGKAPTPKLARAFEMFKMWMLEVYKSITKMSGLKLTDEVRGVFDRMMGEETPSYPKGTLPQPSTLTGTRPLANPNILFQDAEQPFGAYDEASGFVPHSGIMDSGWRQTIRPLMDAMQEGALGQLNERPLSDAMAGLDTPSATRPAGLSQYMNKVKSEMASTKLATVRWGEQQRDFALLNYNKRYGFDRTAEAVYPYELYYTREGVNLLARAIDKPALFSNYARVKMQQQRYERDIPERLRGKIKIPAPWLPEWMGDSLYIDPLGNLFPPAMFLRPFERMQQDKNYQVIEAERVLQEWAADEKYSEAEVLQAAQTQSGTVWERAFAEAQGRREAEVSNPFDFFSVMLGPAWYLSTPLSLAGIKVFPNQGDPSQVNTTPMLNTLRGIDTVTQGTWAEPIGNLIGALGKPEEWVRKKLNLPEFGEYGDYYVDRQLSNMVAEGTITSEQAVMAMIERTGPLFDEARERVKMELALRVPTMGALYAGLNKGPAAGAQAFLPSLFGSGLLPAGELEFRGLKGEWNEAWKRADAGDTQAVPQFFDDHPEYEAYLAKGKEPEERLRSFLIGQIWDGYMALGTTNKKQAAAEMGDLFRQSFLDKETRSYDTLDVDTLTQWAQMLGKMTPAPLSPSTATSPQIPSQSSGYLGGGELNLFDPMVTVVTDQYFSQRTQKFPNFYEEQQGYYALGSKAEKSKYLLAHPEYAAYRKWQAGWYDAYPQFKPIFNGNVFQQVDTSEWPPALLDYVELYAMTGKRLPSGAYKALQQVWIEEGQPMDDFKSWLDSTVVPAMMYGQ
jgi:hypothetical protein